MTAQQRRLIWPWLGFLIALGFHLWHLSIPATIVSDEVFFVTDARNYLTHTTYTDAHPPLGKLQMASILAAAGDAPTMWRIFNAVAGAFIIPVLWWLVWLISKRETAARLAVVLSLLDGFLLVDSRLGLINIPYILYSLLALSLTIFALRSARPWAILTGAAVAAGLALATKWLSLTMLVPALAIWVWPHWFGFERRSHPTARQFAWSLILLIGVPILVYTKVFWLHFTWLGIPADFWGANVQLLQYHLAVPPTGDPYGAPWWGWLLLWRPFLYWSHTAGNTISVIWSMANPWLWWTGAAVFLYTLVTGWHQPAKRFLLVLLLMTWIPFGFIQRIMYSYHAIPFGLFVIALVSIWLSEQWPKRRRLVVGYILAAVFVFAWFLPWYLNLPLTTEQYRWRTWLPSWTIQSPPFQPE
ncbi:MAG: phospholipid carrier-dependent glycosyltransferase [Candidatus Kerfeldbacteria bacterium]|nr:phospholipid carrier-dependent glycosyltransferase [Candidatus Kerfeldbacteria bacterium]